MLLTKRGASWPKEIKERLRLWNRKRVQRRRAKKGAVRRYDFVQRNIIDLTAVPEARDLEGVIGVHLHLYYPDLISSFSQYLKRVPLPFDLYVSISDQVSHDEVVNAYGSIATCRTLVVKNVPNMGRDVAPFFCEFSSQLRKYPFIAHIHGKKSEYNRGATAGWREYLLDNLFKSRSDILKILSLMSGDVPCGIVYPLNYRVLPAQANTWLCNKSLGHRWARELGIDLVPETYFDYPAGFMFWARPDALKCLFDREFQYSDFGPEAGQTDGTLAHALERLTAVAVKNAGFRIGILQDLETPSWSPWRLDRYFERTIESFEKTLEDDDLKVVAFDVFDTLLCRPLLDPEMTKDLVAKRCGGTLGERYLAYRARAESEARSAATRDVNIQQIFDRFVTLANCSEAQGAQLLKIEEQVESASLYPREGAASLVSAALAAGKDVILISDMYLSSSFIAESLERCGIRGWKKIYVSGEAGQRKDSGRLYQSVLDELKLSPRQMLMVGDNERSDWQIPTGLQIKTYHVLRAVDSARANIRFMPILEEIEAGRNLDDHLTLGLVVKQEFARLFYDAHAPENLIEGSPKSAGFSILGPVVAAFLSWLIHDSVASDTIRETKFFFLAREGQALKLAYDRWASGNSDSDAPLSEYLILSRRCVNVAAIQDFEDILKIARADYFLNSASLFLTERYGLNLSDARWKEIEQSTGWFASKTFEIRNSDTSQVEIFLRAVESDIYRQVDAERPALMAYLKTVGLLDCAKPIVVDVGYSGTIQSSLNRLLGTRIQGRYLATDKAARSIFPPGPPNAQGFYANAVERDQHASPILRQSFLLEKLLSSDDPQVLRYELDFTGETRPVYRPLSEAELSTSGTRAEIRKGLLDFIDAALRVKQGLYADFQPSARVAELLYEAYVASPSQCDLSLSTTLVLDDYYCGRGLVS